MKMGQAEVHIIVVFFFPIWNAAPVDEFVENQEEFSVMLVSKKSVSTEASTASQKFRGGVQERAGGPLKVR